MMDENEIVEAPRRSWAWAFAKVVLLGAVVGGLTWGGSRTMEIVRLELPRVKTEATTWAWGKVDSLDRALVSDEELIDMYASRVTNDAGLIALITATARTIPGVQFKSCTGDRREVIECEVSSVRECHSEAGKRAHKMERLHATLGCLGGSMWQQVAIKEISELLIEGAV